MVNYLKLPEKAVCIRGIPSAGKTLVLHSYLSKLAELKLNENKIIPYINARGHLINITQTNNSLNSLYELDYRRGSNKAPIEDLVELENYADTLVIGAPMQIVTTRPCKGCLQTGYLSLEARYVLLLARKELAFKHIVYTEYA